MRDINSFVLAPVDATVIPSATYATFSRWSKLDCRVRRGEQALRS